MSRNKVSYEWAIQTIDTTSRDVHVNDFGLKLSDYDCDDLRDAIMRRHNNVHEGCQLVLIRYFGNEEDGEQDRQYADVHRAFKVIDCQSIMIPNKWQLPSHFDCSTNPIPVRFHNELAAAMKRVM